MRKLLKQVCLLACLVFIGCSDQKTPSPQTESSDAEMAAAEAGDLGAQLSLARKFAIGTGVEKNQAAAFRWFLKAAKAGNVDAELEVARRYGSGLGVTSDVERQFYWLKKAADAGHPEGQRRYAFMLGYSSFVSSPFGAWDFDGAGRGSSIEEERTNIERYLELMEAAAKQEPEAKYYLGALYMRGARSQIAKNVMLIESDVAKGMQLLKESAVSGYWEAQLALASLYQTGSVQTEKDVVASEKYWDQLDGQTAPEIQRAIAYIYHISTDLKEYYAGKSLYRGRTLSFEDMNKVAFAFYQKAASQGDSESIGKLGHMYYRGEGVWKNTQKAVEMFKQAAEMGDYDSKFELAKAYFSGDGVAKDYREAYNWLRNAIAAEPGLPETAKLHADDVRYGLGALYEHGRGVEKDLVLAYAWYNLAASGNYQKAAETRARLESSLTSNELREAQALSREWKPGIVLARTGTAHGSDASERTAMSRVDRGSYQLASIGTGFYVSQDGHVLTNSHVVDECSAIRLPATDTIASLVVRDETNDLALIKADIPDRAIVEFPITDELKQGQDIFVYGFPLDGYLPSSGNITTGIISALAGLNNNSSLIQITAPVQPGNSGGPLFDEDGKVVGVVVGKADAIKIARATGDIPQNVNFAIGLRTVKSFLDSNNVGYKKTRGLFSFGMSSIAIADKARGSVYKIECWR